MQSLLTDAGVFLYPLALCSLVTVFIIAERFLALRASCVFGVGTGDGFVLGRIRQVAQANVGKADLIRSFSVAELSRLERGLFLLDVCAAAAPLLGLLGTVTGLVTVFGNFSFEAGQANTDAFVEGVALALTTTMLGIAVAIPALVASAYFSRRIERIALDVQVEVESLLSALADE